MVKVESTKDQGREMKRWGFRNNLRNSSEEFHRFSRMDCPELVSISTAPANKFLCVKIVYPQGDTLDKDSDIPAASAFSINGRTKGPCLEHHGILVQAAAKETTRRCPKTHGAGYVAKTL